MNLNCSFVITTGGFKLWARGVFGGRNIRWMVWRRRRGRRSKNPSRYHLIKEALL
jgi:hypothetical protein